MTGIIAATHIEAELLVKRLSDKKETSIQGKSFYSGNLHNLPVTICICGVGKVNAAHGAALLFEKFRPGIVYIVGVAGAYPSSGLKIGDVAVASKEIYGDEGVMTGEEFHPMDKLFGEARNSEFKIQNEFPMFVPGELKGLDRGPFLTVSTCTGSLKRGRELEEAFGAVCENMEGAAIAQVCAFNNVPAVEIRGISNLIEDRAAGPLDKDDIILAAENAQKLLKTVS